MFRVLFFGTCLRLTGCVLISAGMGGGSGCGWAASEGGSGRGGALRTGYHCCCLSVSCPS